MSTGDVELADSVRAGGARIENHSAADVIEAAGQWIADIGGYFANQREAVPEVPSWSLVTKIISAAVVYE